MDNFATLALRPYPGVASRPESTTVHNGDNKITRDRKPIRGRRTLARVRFVHADDGAPRSRSDHRVRARAMQIYAGSHGLSRGIVETGPSGYVEGDCASYRASTCVCARARAHCICNVFRYIVRASMIARATISHVRSEDEASTRQSREAAFFDETRFSRGTPAACSRNNCLRSSDDGYTSRYATRANVSPPSARASPAVSFVFTVPRVLATPSMRR